MLDLAIKITTEAFYGKSDKGGVPYIMHCLHVMNEMPDDNELKSIAIMHDLVEDTDWTIDKLRDLGFSNRVLVGVGMMTHYPIGHPEGMSYDDYIKRVAMNGDTRLVKMADLRHNSDIHRMKGLRKKDFDRLEKYHRAYAYLRD